MARSRGRHSIYNRLFLLFLSCMMTLIVIVSVLYYRKTSDIIHTKISDMAEKNISQTVGLFDLLLEGYDSVTKSLNSNYELLRLLEEREKVTDPVLSVINERSITNILGAVYYSRDDIVGIHIITSSGKLYNYEKRYAGVFDLNYKQTDWYAQLQASTGEMVWLGLYNGSVINSLQEERVFVFGRALYDLTTYKKIGIMFIETNPKPILAALSNVTISPNSQVYIVDRQDRIIASTGSEEAAMPSFSGLPRPAQKEVVVDDGTDQLIVSAKAALADWTVFGLTPKADIGSELKDTRQYLLVVIAVLIGLSIAIASLVSRTIASPLKLLIREMKQVELGNFKGGVNVKSFDEINSLVASFNRMVHRMDELIEGITLASISEKNAELQALQSQVNPHFLYNTLDMIYWMLDERENDRLGRVILALSHMFRYSSDWQEASRTTLRQELDQMRHYMTIIESRLEGRVSTEIQIEDRWLDAVMPKMTLQPIIENAVKSGLEPLGRPGRLRVYTEVDAGELRIVIEDDGVGMDEQTLAFLQQSLLGGRVARAAGEGQADTRAPALAMTNGGREAAAGIADTGATGLATAGGGMQPGAAQRRKGIGLPNVHRRIAIMYGDQYGLRIDSKRGEGTTVIVVMPLP
ncbi:two-component system sensor histidine kinase YesM [Paenibacillus methanolicus]|uniref:histidine kinase n=1 Tax=Paenibacillus methanolicus TaxID=582686 RepID=A0A5S5C805_9BACL|nr:two-component system sensor histidine kinase YesM [Paenibacillus methanolicus]